MKILAVVLAVGVLGTGFVAVRQWQSLGDERAQGTQLRERVTALEAAQLAAAALPPPPAQPVAAALQSIPAVPPAPPAAPGATPPAAAPAAAKPSTLAATVLSPQNLEMARSMMRMQMPRQYPDIARDLNLSAAEVEKLFDTISRQQMNLESGSMDLFMGGQLDAAALEAMDRKMRQQQKADDAELSAMLGSKYPQWQDYEGTAAARQQVDQLQGMLDADHRLSEASRKTVITALAAEQGRISRESRDAPPPTGRTTQEYLENQIKQSTDGNRRRLEAASPHLTVAQRDTFRRMLEQQENMTSMMMRSMLAPAGGKP